MRQRICGWVCAIAGAATVPAARPSPVFFRKSRLFIFLSIRKGSNLCDQKRNPIATENTEFTEKNLTAKIYTLPWCFSVFSVLSVAEVFRF
jgi:hypothetical protein